MDNRWLVIGFFIVVAILSVIGITSLAVTDDDTTELLEFCSTEQGCIDVMNSEGMPSSWLSDNNIVIECNGGECYATK